MKPENLFESIEHVDEKDLEHSESKRVFRPWWAVAAAAFSASSEYSSRLCSVRKFMVWAICFRLNTFAQRAYPAPFPACNFA